MQASREEPTFERWFLFEGLPVLTVAVRGEHLVAASLTGGIHVGRIGTEYPLTSLSR